ncbi:hypothetical protein SASPL_111810 [Salvia splendens]|uniref:Uncharacterized protein n=1 Tax=Salvia splendens TaxID=180675 RepID=A0A8X8Y9L9_SALSN|nr:hypothetical protein SASPL_111810 [Salvia splendens]
MSRCLKRLTNKALEFRFGFGFGFQFQFPPLFHLFNFNQSANSLFSLLRRSLFKSMDSLFFSSSNDDDDLFSNSFDQSFLPPSFADPGDSLYLVSFSWWKESVCGGAVVDDTTAVLYDATAQLNGGVGDQSIGGSEILVGLRREEEAGISGHGGEGDLALLSEWMFFTSLKW